MYANHKIILRALAFAAILPLGMSASVQAQNPPEPTFTIGSNELDVVKFVQTVAAATGKTIILDPAVKGKVKIMTNNNAMTKDELFELFRAVLELSNFSVIQVGDVVKIIPIKEARTSPIGDFNQASGGINEVVTDVIPAQNISAAKLLAALRPLVSANYNINHHDGSNSIIITDTRANIERIRRVIKKIDTAAVPTTEVVQLKYAEAEPLVQTLTKLDGADKAAAGLSNKLQMVADARNNAILLAGEDLQRERVKKLIRLLDRPAAQTGNVRVVYLEYADAVKVAATLSKVVQNMSKLGPGNGEGNAGGGATVEADEDTNALLITAEGDALNSLLAVVERLDIRRAQVLVEAIIVELNITDSEQLGTEWLFTNENEGVFGAGPQGGSTAPSIAGAIADESLTSLATSLGGLSGNTFGIAGIGGSENFLALIRALDTSSKANILSTPTLLTMDNAEAEISVGQEVPFQTGSFSSPGDSGNISSPFTTFQRESVGIKLKITPQINEGDKILLDIEQEVSGIDTTLDSGGIVTNQSQILTQVMAADGEIVVLGGLMEEEADESSSKVPILGSIPILGYLFKFQRTDISKKNLMVFLRAEIIRDDDVMSAAASEKYQLIRQKQLENRANGLPLMSDDHLPLLPEATFRDLNVTTTDVTEETEEENDGE